MALDMHLHRIPQPQPLRNSQRHQNLPPMPFSTPSRTATPSTDERPSLPSIGLDISRPGSTSSQLSSQSHYPRRPSPNPSLQLPLPSPSPLPGMSQLSALANIASSSSPNSSTASQDGNNGHFPPYILLPQMNLIATPATAGPGGQPPVCQNCSTSTTPLWRRDENGTVLCNACGLFLKLHGRPRPISLKTNFIKSRNRAKPNQGGRKKATASLPAAHPDAASIGTPNAGEDTSAVAQAAAAAAAAASNAMDAARAMEDVRRVVSTPQALQQLSHQQQLSPPTPSDEHMQMHSPVSRTNTPGFGSNHASNIAPQSVFDSVVSAPEQSNLGQGLYASASFRVPSPSGSINGTASQQHLEPPPSYEVLSKQVTALQTRVNELELINGLFRGRVVELEPRVEEAVRSEEKARQELLEAQETELELKKKIDELERELSQSGKRRREAEEKLEAANASSLRDRDNGKKKKKRRVEVTRSDEDDSASVVSRDSSMSSES